MEQKKSQKEIEFDLLMLRRPNIYGNHFGVRVIRLFLRLSAVFFLICGVILTISAIWEGTMDSFLGLEFLVEKNFKGLLAACCFLIWVSLSISVWFSRMLQKRNLFIMELDSWHKENAKIEEKKRKVDQKR